jgi:hypothetical protein
MVGDGGEELMDPLVVLRTLWGQRVLAVPVVVLTCLAALVVLFYGPRTYQSTATFVLINPKVPTDEELDKKPALARLNSDNPYLRSSDDALAAQVVVSTLTSDTVAEQLSAAGLGPEYTVERSATNSMLVIVTGNGSNPESSLATTHWLSARLLATLRQIQKVNGADDLYLFTALPVDVSSNAKEKVSSRLRTLILVLVGGSILLFGVVSLGLAVDHRRSLGDGIVDSPSAHRQRRNHRPKSSDRSAEQEWEWALTSEPTAGDAASRGNGRARLLPKR